MAPRSLTLLPVVTWQLGHAAFVDLLSLVLGVAAAIALVRFRVNSAWLVLGAASIGLLALQSTEVQRMVPVLTLPVGSR